MPLPGLEQGTRDREGGESGGPSWMRDMQQLLLEEEQQTQDSYFLSPRGASPNTVGTSSCSDLLRSLTCDLEASRAERTSTSSQQGQADIERESRLHQQESLLEERRAGGSSSCGRSGLGDTIFRAANGSRATPASTSASAERVQGQEPGQALPSALNPDLHRLLSAELAAQEERANLMCMQDAALQGGMDALNDQLCSFADDLELLFPVEAAAVGAGAGEGKDNECYAHK